LTAHVAWRVAFATVPFIIVVFVALLILFCAPDTPTGAWKDRHLNQTALVAVGLTEDATSPSPKGQIVDVNKYGMEDASQSGKLASHVLKDRDLEKHEFKTDRRSSAIYDQADVKFAEATLVKKPTIKDVLKVALTLPVLTQCACYFCTFGAELAVNSNLSSFYIQASGTPAWSQTLAANWAAMYGLLNVITRPVGGYIGDLLYPRIGVEGKKFWMIFCIAREIFHLTF
jgi:NNP family nitrate/nitrite transporter-like MFS transporter